MKLVEKFRGNQIIRSFGSNVRAERLFMARSKIIWYTNNFVTSA